MVDSTFNFYYSDDAGEQNTIQQTNSKMRYNHNCFGV